MSSHPPLHSLVPAEPILGDDWKALWRWAAKVAAVALQLHNIVSSLAMDPPSGFIKALRPGNSEA